METSITRIAKKEEVRCLQIAILIVRFHSISSLEKYKIFSRKFTVRDRKESRKKWFDCDMTMATDKHDEKQSLNALTLKIENKN